MHGEGRPLVLLHEAFSAIGTSFAELIPGLSQSRQVVAFELQAHGRNADIDRPLALEGMADDVAEAMRQLGLGQAGVLGYSMGAGVFGDTPAGLPNTRLAVLPGTSHVGAAGRVDWLAPMVNEILDAPIKTAWKDYQG